jgi:hypothetical protein
MEIKTTNNVIQIYKKCCHLVVVTALGRWHLSGSNEWYEEVIDMLNTRIAPDDDIVSVTISDTKFDWKDVVDLSIIREQDIQEQSCTLFNGGSVILLIPRNW